MNIIKDHMGRFVGTVNTSGNKTYVRDFKSGKIVSSYNSNSNKTLSWSDNKTYDGNQAIRFLK